LIFNYRFTIDSDLNPRQIVERLDPLVKRAAGFGGWVDFWLAWDGLSKAKFAGVLSEGSFSLRRVHGLG
jgi:hypothetical protein